MGDLARLLGGRVQGDADTMVQGVSSLESAGRDELSFLTAARYKNQALASRAGAILVGPGTHLPGKTTLVTPDPYVALAQVLQLFHAPASRRPGVSAAATVGEKCHLGEDVEIQGGAILGEGCRLGARACIMSGAVLGAGVTVGCDSIIHPNVTVYGGCEVGDRVIIHAGAVIGSDGFGFAHDGKQYRKIPQVGKVVIDDDVEIGANVTIDRATFGRTTIGRGTKIDNLVQVGHNVSIGEHSVLVAQVGISGSTRIGKNVVFAGQSGAAGHLEIGDGAKVGAKSAVLSDVPAGQFVIGHPAIEASIWKKATAALRRLPDIRRRLMRIEGKNPQRARPRGDKEA